jgi:membrane-associated phospholipid phosphatase
MGLPLASAAAVSRDLGHRTATGLRVLLTRAAVLGVAALPLRAQDAVDAPATARTFWHEVRRVPDDIAWALAGPGRLDGREAATAAGVLAVSGVLSIWDDDIDRWIVRHDTTSRMLRLIRPVREGTRFALGELPTGTRMPAIGMALYAAGFVGRNANLREAGLGCISTWVASAGARYALYYTAHRLRPDSADGDQYRMGLGGQGWQRQSFFGGHVANAMACSSFLAERFDLGAAEPVLFIYSGAVGVARMADRRHWASDIAVGTAFGLAVGRAVAGRSSRRAARPEDPPVPLVTVRLTF